MNDITIIAVGTYDGKGEFVQGANRVCRPCIIRYKAAGYGPFDVELQADEPISPEKSDEAAMKAIALDICRNHPEFYPLIPGRLKNRELEALAAKTCGLRLAWDRHSSFAEVPRELRMPVSEFCRGLAPCV